MQNGNPLAERLSLLWFAIVSKTHRQALENPSPEKAQELGVEWDSLRDVSEIVRECGLLEPLDRIRQTYGFWCSPPPCEDFAPYHLEGVLHAIRDLHEAASGKSGAGPQEARSVQRVSEDCQ